MQSPLTAEGPIPRAQVWRVFSAAARSGSRFDAAEACRLIRLAGHDVQLVVDLVETRGNVGAEINFDVIAFKILAVARRQSRRARATVEAANFLPGAGGGR